MNKTETGSFCFNPFYEKSPDWSGFEFNFLKSLDMPDFHKSLEGNKKTPLLSLEKLATELGIKALYIKDESHRFGIKAFKALGASYAIYRFLKSVWENKFNTDFSPENFSNSESLQSLGEYTFCAATDGNHGRAVAWTAKKLAQKAVIYMPANSAKNRIKNIEGEGAKVILVPGSFDDCVLRCAADAKENNWQVISDTAYEGYMDIPKFIMLGYSTIFRELEDEVPANTDRVFNSQENSLADIVFLPAGVGGLAASGVSYFTERYKEKRPKFVIVEPNDSDCYLESIRNGKGQPLATKGKLESIMVGLACGVPSVVAWPILKSASDLFISIPDNYALKAMRAYKKENIISGESGSAGLAGLLAMFQDAGLAAARKQLGLSGDSTVLIINTEGDTDPENYQAIVGTGS